MAGSFRARLKAGERLIGTMVTIPSATTAEILADVGYDWLFVDGEHGPLGTSDVLAILQAVGDRVPCIVRVPGTDEGAIKRVLDLGAAGIIVPQTNTARQVADVVRYSRYAPVGARGVGLGRAHGYGMRFQEYMDKANDEVVVIVQAEHADAVHNIYEMVAVPGIDAILLGPYDLAASLGRMGQITHPEVTGAIDRVTAACREVGMPLGIFGLTAESLQPYLNLGYSLIVASVDTLFLGGGAKSLLSQLRS